MMMLNDEKIISQTQKWIQTVVIGSNFCPFAAKPFRDKTICYKVLSESATDTILEQLMEEWTNMDNNVDIETTFIIIKTGYENFYTYLDLIEKAESSLIDNGKEGSYQLASFHPDYCFEGADTHDPANYTNRSVYPMIHILREASIDSVTSYYPDIENIPHRNIEFARHKGLQYMQALRAACLI